MGAADPPWAQPLAVTATLAGPVALRDAHPLPLDALLLAALAVRDRLPPLVAGAPAPDPPPLPLATSACGRIALASAAVVAGWDAHETRHRNRRFPVLEARALTTMTRVDTAVGAQKSYRVPYAAAHARGDALAWWCVGDAAAIRALLALVHFLGRHRGVGLGRVTAWDVRAVAAPWPGFPVLDRAGVPLRPVPLDWPGLGDHAAALAALRPPSWGRRVPCAVAP